VRNDVTNMQSQLDTLKSSMASNAPAGEKSAQAGSLASSIQTSRGHFEQFAKVEAGVIVRPFVPEVKSVVKGARTITDFYAPAAVMLLVQQCGIAFGALSFVREQQLGIIDVYRAAPLGPVQTVIGKYIGYLVAGGLVAVVLTVMVVEALGVPTSGPIGDLAAVTALMLAASIGLGLVISLISPSDTQAVQYAMLVLLASLFFTGFFLNVNQLAYPARVIAWLIPATYAISAARDNMLRGRGIEATTMAALAGYVATVFVLALFGARRRLTPERR